jgi:serine/threonine-protein kinase
MRAGDPRWSRVNEVFHAAVAVSPADRDAFLSTQCGADAALRAEVESLLAMHRDGDERAVVPLRSGFRFGDYEITGFIASGAMGEVYRARDTRLGRDAALKVLPTAVVSDPDRRARFEREARTLASLTHPHIATIYGVEEADGISALALELVDGETLADRIARGRLPVDEALRIARQIAQALETAHEHGIVHRDLKPANVKITRDGVVKVLDFGLAKLADSRRDAILPPASAVATLPHLTNVGVIVGTPAYMSPEQARGERADQRSDIWAFGCVLYEMLTGQPAFSANTVADTLARVLASEPNMAALLKGVPETVRTLITRCLAKDRAQRIPHVSVIRYLLDESTAAKRDESWRAWTLQLLQDRNSRVVVIVALVFLIPALGELSDMVRGALTNRPAAPQPLVARFEIALPPEQAIWPTNDGMNIAISSDGARIAYAGSATAAGESQLVIRRLDELRGTPVRDTDGARNPFFSPDGQWVAFFAGNEIRKMSVAGGATMTICRFVPLGENRDASATWGPDDIIYFSRDRDDGDGLQSVPASGGEPRPVVGAFENLERGVGWPSVLPRRRGMLLSVKGAEGGGALDLLDIGSGRRKSVLGGAQWAQYVEGGYLVYVANQTLQAVRFDVERSTVTGNPVTVLPGVSIAGFGISKTGTLAYVAGRPLGTNAGIRTLVWVDRNGQETPTGAPPRSYGSFRLAPNSERLAVDIRGAQPGSIWIWDFTRQTLTRLDTSSENAINPVWTPTVSTSRSTQRATIRQSCFWSARTGLVRSNRCRMRIMCRPQKRRPRMDSASSHHPVPDRLIS